MTHVAHDAPAFLIPETTAHPDTALILAWEGYRAARKAEDELAEAGQEETEQFEELYRLDVKFRDLIEELPARTAAGIAIKLKYIFIFRNETAWASQAILEDGPVNEEEMDLADGMILDLIDNVGNMGDVA